jgi:hypothetical protein
MPAVAQGWVLFRLVLLLAISPFTSSDIYDWPRVGFLKRALRLQHAVAPQGAQPQAALRPLLRGGGPEGEAVPDGGRGRPSGASDVEGEAAEDSASLVQLSVDVDDGRMEAYRRKQFPAEAQDTEDSSASDPATSSQDRGTRGPRGPRTDRGPRKRERERSAGSESSPTTTAPGSAELARDSVGGGRAAAPQPDETSTESEDSSEQAAAERRKRKKVAEPKAEDKAPEYRDTRPMICKEFAERGTCRYGLSCIFLHDRSAYYAKWKAKVREDRRRARQDARKASRISQHCPICKDRYTEPVVTECNHYFCSTCILEWYDEADDVQDTRGRGGRTCPVCSGPLSGSFKLVYDLQDRLNQQLHPTRSSVSRTCLCVCALFPQPPPLFARALVV